MNKRPVRQSSENRTRKGAIAILRGSVSARPSVEAIARQSRMSEIIYALFLQIVERLSGGLRKRRKLNKLKLLDLQQLGEKRFVAVVRVGKQKFLIGGAATSVSLLAEIDTRHAVVNAPRPLGQERA